MCQPMDGVGAAVRKVVQHIHQDGNGFIDRRELAIMMRHLGEPLTEEEIVEILDEADTDGDGVIDYTEFFTLMGRWTERKW